MLFIRYIWRSGLNIETILGAMWHLANGKEASIENEVYHCNSTSEVSKVLKMSQQLTTDDPEKAKRINQYQSILKPISEHGTRFISNQFEHYFIVQCPVDMERLDDAMEFESLDDMLESMAIVHDKDQDELENTAVIVRNLGYGIVACDVKGCWKPYPTPVNDDQVESFINHFQL